MKKYLLLLSFLILQYVSTQAENNATGFPCNQSHFYALGNGNIEELEVSGNSVISHGIVLSGVPGSSLAFCDNVDGGSYSPTIYSGTSTNVSHYNGATWDTVNFTPQTYMGGCGGYGANLYYTQPGSNHPYFYTYNAGLLTGLTVNMAPAVADVAVDVDGNFWYFAGLNQISSRIRQVSPTGTVLKEFNCNIDTYNAYGCFLLNGVLYLGLGSLNTVNPNSLIPITFTVDSAYIGTPMSMPPSTSYTDLASCSPGNPVSVAENSFDKSFVLYPNPADDQINISTSSILKSYTIYDMRGAKIKFGFADVQAIDISYLISGIYFIECETEKGVMRRKFVKG